MPELEASSVSSVSPWYASFSELPAPALVLKKKRRTSSQLSSLSVCLRALNCSLSILSEHTELPSQVIHWSFAWQWFFRVSGRPSSFPDLFADARGWKPELLFSMWTCERLWEGSISNRLLINYLAVCLAGNLLLEFSTLALKMHFWNLSSSHFFGLIAMGKSEGRTELSPPHQTVM